MHVQIVRESVRYDMRAQWVVRDGDKPGDIVDMGDLAGERYVRRGIARSPRSKWSGDAQKSQCFQGL